MKNTIGVEDALQQAIHRAKNGDAFAPVHVVAPTGRSAQSLARRVGRSGGSVNVQFLTLERLAGSIVESAGMSPRWLTSEVKRELVRRVAARARPPLEGHEAVLVQCLLQAFDDLRLRSDGEVQRIAEESRFAREIVRLHAMFRLFSSSFMDARDVVEAATSCVDASTVPVVPVVALVVEPPSAAESELLAALHAASRLTVLALTTGESSPDAALQMSLWGMDAIEVGSLVDSNVEAVAVLPDADAEVRHAVGLLLQAAEKDGVSFGRMALLFSAASPYALLAREHLVAAGVSVSGRDVFTLGHSVAGRFLRGLFQLHLEDFSRFALDAFLSCAPVIDPSSGELVDVAAWRRVAKAARVTASAQQWSSRLRAYATSDEARRGEQVTPALECERFVSALATRLDVSPTRWADWAVWAQQAIETHLGGAGQRETWPRDEQHAAGAVERVLLALGALDDVGEYSGDITIDVFAAALGDQLSRARQSMSNASGVFLGTIAEAVACDFDVAVVCGAVEGSLPSPLTGDALTTALRVPGEETSGESDRRSWRLLLGQCGTVTLTTPIADQRAQRERRPSPWLLEEASRLAGRLVQTGELRDGSADHQWLRVVPSFTRQVETDEPMVVERRQARLLALSEGCSYDNDVELALHSSIETVRARDGSMWSRFDGFVGRHELLAGSAGSTLAISPTSLEHWAQCPFRYFLRSALGVAENQQDDEPTKTMARDRGMLVHAALERFVREAAPRSSPDQPWEPDERGRLHQMADKLYDNSRAQGRSPDGLLLELERVSLHQHLDAVLDDDVTFRSLVRVVPAPSGVEVGLSVRHNGPVPVTFRGRVDRVDRAFDGSRIVAIDYKTGRAEKFPDLGNDPVDGGRRLQLAVYAKALAEQHPGARVEAQYWFVTDDKSGYARRGVTFDESTSERLDEVLGVVTEGIEAGVFPPLPGRELNGSYENCRHCAYDSMCPSDRGELWDRKNDEQIETTLGRLGHAPVNVAKQVSGSVLVEEAIG